MTKRAFDLVASVCGVLVLSPLFAVVSVLIAFDSGRPVFYTQDRIGRDGRRFRLFKFRTMVRDAETKGRPITVGNDPRVTRIGRWLRRTKLDELPQLVNVVRGDMSLVGPRPELPMYVELFPLEYERLLRVRPGITDRASILYRDESDRLGRSPDPDVEYRTRILPDKLRLSAEYLESASIWSDLGLIVRTLVGPRADRRT
jgi:lipopolysaccharide/colanic/teichoic acid biosynthesis glycosyltransferase